MRSLKEMEDKIVELKADVSKLESEWWEIDREKHHKIDQVKLEYMKKSDENNLKQGEVNKAIFELRQEVDKIGRGRKHEQHRNVWFT